MASVESVPLVFLSGTAGALTGGWLFLNGQGVLVFQPFSNALAGTGGGVARSIWHAGNFAPSPATGNVPTWNGFSWVAQAPATGGGVWGAITGTLSSQTDLQAALNTKSSASTLTKVSISATDPVLSNLVDGELRLVY